MKKKLEFYGRRWKSNSIKCVLTCAKTNVEPNGENAIPGRSNSSYRRYSRKYEKTFVEPTQEEKRQCAKKLMQNVKLYIILNKK